MPLEDKKQQILMRKKIQELVVVNVYSVLSND
jgi:hypothetical protein